LAIWQQKKLGWKYSVTDSSLLKKKFKKNSKKKKHYNTLPKKLIIFNLIFFPCDTQRVSVEVTQHKCPLPVLGGHML
jgi:hypothetical protein